jgi:hypothetical protein
MALRRLFIVVLVLTALWGLYSFVKPEDDPLGKIKQVLTQWTTTQPVEKVYLQFDKPYYAAGEDIWFKAYVVSGSGHNLTNLSNVVDVELVSEHGAIAQHIKLQLQSGIAAGDLALPDTLKQGIYHLRAYTRYMLNAGSDYFFDKAINIINIQTTPHINVNKTAATGNIDVQFFPESGYLVNGINSTVAFKAIGADGAGVNVSGIITDNQGRQVVSFESMHLGMGKFQLIPVKGLTYQANITDINGEKRTIALPKAIDEGYVLLATNDDFQRLRIKVVTSKANRANKPLFITAQSRGELLFTEKIIPTGNASFLFIPKSKFSSGIIQLTLFSSTGEPLNERLVFIQNPDQLHLTLATDQSTYAPRQQVKVDLLAEAPMHQPAVANFSVAVTDETKVPVNPDDENNIYANLLLTSDLKGYIEQPAWYFNHPPNETAAALDVLMLTQGYRRFEWRTLMNNALPPQPYPAEKGLQVAGTVLNDNGKPVANGKVTLYDLDSIQFTRETITDKHGRFTFNNLVFDDSVRFIVQARNAKNKKDVNIKMDSPVVFNASSNWDIGALTPGSTGNLAVYTQSSKQLYQQERIHGLGNHVFTLQEVTIREKKELMKYSSNLNGPGNADQIIQGKELRDIGCINISDCLQGRLLGVVFRNGIPYSTRGYSPMQVIVDGVYVEASYLNTLNYNDIQGIEILRTAGLTSIYGGRGGNGVLLVTTRHGGDDDDYPEPIFGRGITTYYPIGYYRARTFYAPHYGSPKTINDVADLRTTIHWQPNLVTNQAGKTSFTYFNAGSKGTYRVVVEGLDHGGHIGRAVYHYRVQ